MRALFDRDDATIVKRQGVRGKRGKSAQRTASPAALTGYGATPLPSRTRLSVVSGRTNGIRGIWVQETGKQRRRGSLTKLQARFFGRCEAIIGEIGEDVATGVLHLEEERECVLWGELPEEVTASFIHSAPLRP
jgi:hypothetical protein